MHLFVNQPVVSQSLEHRGEIPLSVDKFFSLAGRGEAKDGHMSSSNCPIAVWEPYVCKTFNNLSTTQLYDPIREHRNNGIADLPKNGPNS